MLKLFYYQKRKPLKLNDGNSIERNISTVQNSMSDQAVPFGSDCTANQFFSDTSSSLDGYGSHKLKSDSRKKLSLNKIYLLQLALSKN